LSALHLNRRRYPFRFPFSVAEVVEWFCALHGPTNRAFSSFDAAGQAALRADLEQLWTRHHLATGGTILVAAEILDVQAVRRRWRLPA
jgi:hypothetical protein